MEIVHSKCNLSAASKRLNISQPALSAIIRNFERGENIQLFERYNGRLQNLTPSGEIFYEHALILLSGYANMLNEVRESSVRFKGKIRIGIPPLVLSVFFSDILPKMIIENPDIEFELIEQGAFELRKLLIAKNLDFAVLLQHMDIIPGATNRYLLHESELSAFMNADNLLAENEKIRWNQLNNHPVAIFQESFMIHHLLMDQFSLQNVYPKVSLMSANWDFLFFSTRNSDMITILPSPISTLLNVPNVVERRFHDPIPWKVTLHQPKKSRYNHIEKYVLKLIMKHFEAAKAETSATH